MSSAAGSDRDGGTTGKRHAAGAFDVRNIIAGLIGFYGVVLVIVGLVDNGAAQQARTGRVNANLWAGLVMIVVGLAFFVWTRLRPIVVDPTDIPADDDRPPGH
ncbi:MAG: hypothetical protein JWO98_3019 [Frankiales bacterium]|nr:hypothetical protein [Frankiales bacterium]